MSKTVSLPGWIYLHQFDWEDAPSFKFVQADHMPPEYKPVVPHVVTFTLPDGFDPIKGQVEALHAQIRKTRAEAQLTVTKLEERIQKLLAIEHRPEMVDE